MENNTIISVTNRSAGTLSYELPELQIRRHFTPNETKEVEFYEIKSLYQTEGGYTLIKNCLSINSEEAIKSLEMEVEPEYFYGKEEIKRVMTEGSLEEFLDMLDFAPSGVLDMVKNMAVTLPLNDVSKRKAILEKLQFNVDRVIEIQNMDYDGGEEDTTSKDNGPKRRVVKEETTDTTPKRRVVRKSE